VDTVTQTAYGNLLFRYNYHGNAESFILYVEKIVRGKNKSLWLKQRIAWLFKTQFPSEIESYHL